MKKIILLLLFMSIKGFSQDCKFHYNEVDSFTKLKKVKTKSQTISEGNAMYLKLSLKKSDELFLVSDLTFTYSKSVVIGRDAPISILLKNDDVINLSALDLTYGEINSQNQTEIQSVYIINLNQIELIRKIGIKKIRVESSKSNFDFDVKKKKWTDKFNDSIDCFYNEITYR